MYLDLDVSREWRRCDIPEVFSRPCFSQPLSFVNSDEKLCRSNRDESDDESP